MLQALLSTRLVSCNLQLLDVPPVLLEKGHGLPGFFFPEMLEILAAAAAQDKQCGDSHRLVRAAPNCFGEVRRFTRSVCISSA